MTTSRRLGGGGPVRALALASALAVLQATGAAAPTAAPTVRLETAPGPAPRRSVYRLPVRVQDAPGYFRPRRHYAALLTSMANPPSWWRPGRMGLGVWVEPPDRPATRPHLPHVLHAGDRVHTGPRGLARIDLPRDAVAWMAAETILRVAGDGALPTTQERVRLAVEPGLAWIRTPWHRPLEIEVPHGLLHLEWGEVVVEAPSRQLSEEDHADTGHLVLLKGRATLHGRGRHRHRRRPLAAGQTLSWSTPDPVYWTVAASSPRKLADLEEYFLRLEDGQLVELEEPPRLGITQPRKVEGLVQRRAGPAGPGPGPGPGTPPPTRPATKPPPTRPPTRPPTKPPTRPPTKPPKDPFADPFGDDPFGGDPFEGDPFGGEEF